MAVDREGRYMATAGMDRKLTIWDIRNFKELHSYFTPMPATSVSISQRGLLSVSYGNYCDVWKDAFASKQKMPYMRHHQPGCQIMQSQFCPFEDVLGLGHAKGMSSLVIPGLFLLTKPPLFHL
jgi:U3 small nucleolar RNA-associated protein 7